MSDEYKYPMIYVKTNKEGASCCCITANHEVITRRFLPMGKLETFSIGENPELSQLWDRSILCWDATMLDALANEVEEPDTEPTPELAVAH